MISTKVTSDFFTLTNHRISNVSFIRLFNIMEDEDNVKFMNFFRSYTINKDILDDTLYFFTYDVESNDWWDIISFKKYGTPHLWWLVCMMNDVINPFEELEAGDQIKILKESYLYSLLREMKNISEQ